ncbi:hypothetical protein RJZ90_006287 [Blastomyces dermatitidis]
MGSTGDGGEWHDSKVLKCLRAAVSHGDLSLNDIAFHCIKRAMLRYGEPIISGSFYFHPLRSFVRVCAASDFRRIELCRRGYLAAKRVLSQQVCQDHLHSSPFQPLTSSSSKPSPPAVIKCLPFTTPSYSSSRRYLGHFKYLFAARFALTSFPRKAKMLPVTVFFDYISCGQCDSPQRTPLTPIYPI